MSNIINRTVVNEYYPCGALLAEKRVKNGKLDGVSKYYKKDGRLWAKQFWINKRFDQHDRMPVAFLPVAAEPIQR